MSDIMPAALSYTALTGQLSGFLALPLIVGILLLLLTLYLAPEFVKGILKLRQGK